MARSLARTALPLARVGCEGAQLALERLDPVLHRLGLAVAEVEAAEDHDDGEEGADQVQQVCHVQALRSFEGGAGRSATGRASVPQSLPPAHSSFFQMGTVALRVSISHLAASNASLRCGALATTTTAASSSSSRPTRWSNATRPTPAQRRRASSASARRRSVAGPS